MNLKQITFAIISFTLATNCVLAANCGDPSPGKVADNLYGEIHIRPLTKTEHRDLSALLKGLTGRKKGKASEFICVGKDGLGKESSEAKLEVEVDFSSAGVFALNSELSYDKKNRTESLVLIVRPDRVRMERDSQYGDIELVSVARDKFTFIRKIYTGVGTGRRSVQEQLITIEPKAIEFVVFHQGILSSVSRWTF